MAKYPYSVSPNRLKDFMQKLPILGFLDKITQEKLMSLGYKSNNDRAIIPILRFIGFLDAEGRTTEVYKKYRIKSQSGAVLATALRQAYSELFDTYPDAQNKDTEALRDFFTPAVEAGEAVLANTVNTFKAMSDIADFEGESEEITVGTPKSPVDVKKITIPQGSGVTVNVNIQIQLPPSENSEVYDKIFESLKKHVLQQ